MDYILTIYMINHQITLKIERNTFKAAKLQVCQVQKANLVCSHKLQTDVSEPWKTLILNIIQNNVKTFKVVSSKHIFKNEN